MKNNLYFTKQSYLSGLRCTKSLYLQTHNPKLVEVDNGSQALILNGKDFELVARDFIAPGGLDLTSDLGSLDKRIIKTKTEFSKKNIILYKATFKNDEDEIAVADLLVKNDEGVHLIEIKAVTRLIDLHYYDVSYQYHVISKAGVKINKVSLVYINKDYVRGSQLANDLLVIDDVTNVVKRIQPKVSHNIQRLKKILKSKEAPEKEIGEYCLNPEKCSYKNHCWDNLPTNNIFQLRSMRLSKKWNLFYQGINDMEQLVDNSRIQLTEGQIIQVTCALENKTVLQLSPLKEWLYPLEKAQGIYFMDFEAIAPAVPLYEGTKPFAQICTQYSIHYKDKATNELMHMDFLAEPGTDPRKAFIKNLIVDLTLFDEKAPIVVYNKTYEESRLRDLAKVFPEYADDIKSIINRITDMMNVFKNKWYHHPCFQGSYSIKAVLPVMCPEVGYKDLKINNGAQAAYEYSRLGSLSKEKAKEIKKALLAYCKRDTEAMVYLLEQLEIIAYNKKNIKVK